MCGTWGEVRQGEGLWSPPTGQEQVEPQTRARPPVMTRPAPSSLVEAEFITDVATRGLSGGELL